MQDLTRTSSLGTAYTAADVATQLQRPNLAQRWIVDRLDRSMRWTSDLTPFVDWGSAPTVTHDSTADVKRRLQLQLLGTPTLDPMKDLLRVHYQLLMPDGGWVDWSIGTFLLRFPRKEITPRLTRRTLEGLDLGQLLIDANFVASSGVPAGTGYGIAVGSVAGSYGGATPLSVQIPDSGKALPTALGWQAGESRLKAVNDLLAAINFTPAWFDELGVMRSGTIPDYTAVTESYIFDAMKPGIAVGFPIQEEPDESRAFNQALVRVQDPERGALSAFYENTRADSPVSVPNWRPKLQTIDDSRLADLDAAGARAKSAVQEAARIYAPIRLITPPWAFSQDRDVYRLIYSTTDEGVVNATYLETYWQHVCRSGAPTIHEFSKIVPA